MVIGAKRAGRSADLFQKLDHAPILAHLGRPGRGRPGFAQLLVPSSHAVNHTPYARASTEIKLSVTTGQELYMHKQHRAGKHGETPSRRQLCSISSLSADSNACRIPPTICACASTRQKGPRSVVAIARRPDPKVIETNTLIPTDTIPVKLWKFQAACAS